MEAGGKKMFSFHAFHYTRPQNMSNSAYPSTSANKLHIGLAHAFVLFYFADITHTFKIKISSPWILMIPESGASGFCLRCCQKRKQSVCWQNADYHLSLMAHESGGNGSVMAP